MKMQTTPVSTRQCCPPPCVFILDNSLVRNWINLRTEASSCHFPSPWKSWTAVKQKKKCLTKHILSYFGKLKHYQTLVKLKIWPVVHKWINKCLSVCLSVCLSADIVNYHLKSVNGTMNETITFPATWSPNVSCQYFTFLTFGMASVTFWTGLQIENYSMKSTLIKNLTETSMWHHSCADASRADPGDSNTAFRHATF